MREYTNKMYTLIDEGVVDTKALAEQLLTWLSEEDVKQFWFANEYQYTEPEADEDE